MYGQNPLPCDGPQHDILGKISARRDEWPDLMRRLQQDNLPLILLGIGPLGELFFDLLQYNEIPVSVVAVHQKFWREGMAFRGREVLALENVLASDQKVNVLCAMQYLHTTKTVQESLLSTGCVNQALVYDTGCVHHGFRGLTFDFVTEYQDAFSWLYKELADERSRETLIAYLNQRISGRPGYLEAVFDPCHLFPPDIIHLNADETFVDCGAFDGESILDFQREMQSNGFAINQPIYAFEPDDQNRRILAEKCRHLPTLHIVPLGAWSEKIMLRFSDGTGATSRITSSRGVETSMSTIDHILEGSHTSYIKMDIEGAELEALFGASKTIRRDQPKLGISVYHRVTDLVFIPRYVRRLLPTCSLYLRAHSYGANDLLLYAI